jgi:adenine phosphoribosyltransferase
MEKLRESDTVNKVDAVLAPEAMAFLFAGPIASSLQKPVVLARKSRRLPGDVDSASYAGSNITNLMNKDTSCSEHDSFHIAAGSIVPGQKVLIVDDCLASGATLDCLVQLVHAQGGDAKSLACVMELPDMGGGAVARNLGIVVLSLFQFDGS